MNTAAKTLWIDAAILTWAPEFSGGARTDSEKLRRPHEILAHAYALLSGPSSAFVFADVLSNLKRAVNSRLQHLEQCYRLTSLFPRSVGALDRLEGVGLAKPFLIRQLFDLRNDVEHNDALPPSKQRCAELADITWYFLQTTHYACKVVVDGVTLHPDEEGILGESGPWLSVRIGDGGSPVLPVYGWLPASLLGDHPITGALPLLVGKQRDPGSTTYSDGTPVRESVENDHGPDERFVKGTVVASDQLRRALLALALQTL